MRHIFDWCTIRSFATVTWFPLPETLSVKLHGIEIAIAKRFEYTAYVAEIPQEVIDGIENCDLRVDFDEEAILITSN